MKERIKNFLRPLVPKILLKSLKKLSDKKLIDDWKKNGCPIPPPHIVKQLIIAEYQQKYGHSILLETGTYMGTMVEAQKSNFNKIISIELGIDLFEKAQKRFENDKNITIVQGDSGKVLGLLLKDISEPIIFWLDGHYSAGTTALGDKECPIFEELDAIFDSKQFNHVILIDDAREFVGNGDYPSIEKLTDYIKNKNDKYQVEVKDDIIRYAI